MTMTRLAWPILATVFFVAGMGLAQEPHTPKAPPARPLSLGELTPTPEMWFYEQAMRRYQDPKYAVRAKAEYRTAQRQRRMAAQKWFGYSTARPMVSPDPMYGTFSPRWGSNGNDPWLWRGIGGPTVVLPPQSNIAHPVR
jgi:hypothetical protein